MKHPTTWRLVALLLATVGPLTFASCKEGDPLGGGTVVAVPSLEAEVPDVASAYVALADGGVNGSRILVDVTLTEVPEPVSGIALKVKYPASIARFVSCKDGNLFPVPGTCFYPASGTDTGTVFVGRSIQAPQQPVQVVGTKVVVRLEFIVFARGSGPITFEAKNLGGGDASAVLDADGDPILMTWFEGGLVGE